MSEYVIKMRLLAEHVDFKSELRLDTLMHIFQECSIAHTEELGMGRKKTLDKGLLWIITTERFQINRLPKYDETIKVICYPGKTLHYFFPRYLEILDEEGNVLIKGTSIWALINSKDRSMVDPIKNKIIIEGKEKGSELPPILNLSIPELDNEIEEEATYSKVDLNGHMNNASYLNLAMDLIDKEILENKAIKNIDLQFKKEIKLFDKFTAKHGQIDNIFYLSSPEFIIKLTFK